LENKVPDRLHLSFNCRDCTEASCHALSAYSLQTRQVLFRSVYN